MPMRILLVGAVVFLAAWFTVLKPKPAEIAPSTTSTTPTTGPGKAVDAAKKAAGQTTETTTTDTDTAPATTTAPETAPEAAPAAAIPAEALAKLPKDVAGALEKHKVVVLGVFGESAKPWRQMSDDDRYVRNALRETNRYDGGVFVKNVKIENLSTYGPLINDLHVSQSPAIVVIDAKLKGRVLTGYADRISINQVIADAHDASVEPDIKDAYLRRFSDTCGRFNLRAERWSWPTMGGKKATAASLDRALRIVRSYRHTIARTAAPAKWRAMRAGWIKAMNSTETVLLAQKKAVKSGSIADLLVAIDLFTKSNTSWTALDRRFNAAGVTGCQLNRQA
jgi:hypothetical protein